MGQFKATPHRAEETLNLIDDGVIGILDNGRIVDYWEYDRVRHSHYETIVRHLMAQSYVEQSPRNCARPARHGAIRKWTVPLRLTGAGRSLANRWKSLQGGWQ